MNITFEYDGIKSSADLEGKISKKLNKLSSKYEFIVQAHVFLKTRKTSSNTQGRICKVQLSIPGPLLFAESHGNSFEGAIIEVVNDLERQLAKRKGKMKRY